VGALRANIPGFSLRLTSKLAQVVPITPTTSIIEAIPGI
jgi:hypothetical protein